MKKRFLAVFMCVILILSVFCGCEKQSKKTVDTGAKVVLNGDKIYPVSSDGQISYLMYFNGNLQSLYENFIETPLGQEIEKRSGVKVEYIHPQIGTEAEQVSLLIASNELPDIVQHSWFSYPGGPDAAIEDNVLFAFNDYIEDYAPNFKKFLDENQDVNKKIKTDAGNYYTVPFVRNETWMGAYLGLVLRKDWLDKVGMEIPKTIDEFENVLKEFKTIAGSEPFYLSENQKSVIMFAHGIGEDFYVDEGGIVKYGPMQPEYKEVLKRMNKWYSEGLLHPDFAVVDGKKLDSSILNSKIGAFYGAVGGAIGKYLRAKPTDTPDFDLVAIPQITQNGDEIPEFGSLEDNVNINSGTAISTNCKNIELALRYLDYGFSKEGHMLYNFGLEGVSYNMVDGEPKLTELLTNNPDGESIDAVAPRYLRASYSGPFVQDSRYVKQSLVFPQQVAAYEAWGKSKMDEHLMPPVTLLADEIDKSSDIYANINTYVGEMYVRFVNGSEPIDNFDKYIEQLKEFGIEELLKMKEAAYKRYNSR